MSGALDAVQAELARILSGKDDVIEKALCCLLAEGHVLLQDVPGTGKTTLSQALASVLGLDYTRIQFTSDLMPSDVIGSLIFDAKSSEFRFQKGPVFTQLLLADEINRAAPKSQSALLEAMAEQHVSVDGEAYPLPDPFFVIATQNPHGHLGTFPLPESQLDRFMLRLSIGYPDTASEQALLKGETGRGYLKKLSPQMDADALENHRKSAANIHASDSLIAYVMRLIQETRNHPELEYGVSPRAGLSLLQCAKARAYLRGNDFVSPEDIQALLKDAWAHRLEPATKGTASARSILQKILDATPVL